MKFLAILAVSTGFVSTAPTGEPELQAREVCPDPFSPCQYAEGDGTCTTGMEGCIKKMGCNVCVGGEANCLGCASGCAIAC